MIQFPRITVDPEVMGGKPCIRGMRVTVGMIVDLVASGRSETEIQNAYPYLEADDIKAALDYTGWLLKVAPEGRSENAEIESLGRAGEALAGQVLPREDFSDWER